MTLPSTAPSASASTNTSYAPIPVSCSTTLRAATFLGHVASQRVLPNAGFIEVGVA